jgi:hypothetical protein
MRIQNKNFEAFRKDGKFPVGPSQKCFMNPDPKEADIYFVNCSLNNCFGSETKLSQL